MQVLTKGITKARFLPAEGADVLVVLIGWWLAKQRHLSKYEPIWHIHGCATLSFLPNMANSTFISETRQLLRNLEEYLKDNKKVKIIFHVFSNNGLMFLTKLLNNIESDLPRSLAVQESVYGCVFDSCPGFLTIFSGYKAFAASNKNVFLNKMWFKGLCCTALIFGIVRYLIYAIRYLPFCLILIVVSYLFSWLRNKQYHDTFSQSLQKLKNCKSKLFLYSTSDQLCTSTAIKSALDNVKKLDMRKNTQLGQTNKFCVFDVCFQKSAHVAHSIQYPKRYKLECKKVLDRVIAQP
eukprot:g6068.t1